MRLKKIIIIIVISLTIFGFLNATPYQKGERPLIDLTCLDESAYHTGYIRIKLNPEFAVQSSHSAIAEDNDDIVRLGIAAIDELNKNYGVREIRWLYNTELLDEKYEARRRAWGFHLWYELYFSEEVSIPEVVSAYEQLPEIIVAEPEYKKELLGTDLRRIETNNSSRWTPNDPQFTSQWNLNNTGQSGGTPGSDLSMVNGWNIEKGHSEVIVAVLDEGIDYDHVDLVSNMWPYIGYNYHSNSMTVTPGDHGTFVAGIIAAATNNSTGIAGIAGGSGSSDGVRLMSAQIVSDNNFNNIHLAMMGAADLGAAIAQNSWTYTPAGVYEQIVLDAIDYFNANGGGDVMDGGVVIFAAGNSNSSGDWYPACYSGSYAVAATNNQDQKAYYSNFASWVDISAPGGETDFISSRGIRSTVMNNGYEYAQGTSVACPHASAVAALVISLAYRYDVILENDTVLDILSDSADDHYAVNPDYVGLLGSGRLNAYEALLLTQTHLGNVMNPALFTATTAGLTEISLEWEQNSNNDNVMILWSEDDLLGSPVSGTSYAVGEELPGGGTVLYAGSASSFNHTGLQENTIYYYKAFSYTAGYDYSLGRRAVGRTDYTSLVLPFGEYFNESFDIPDLWQIIDHNGMGQAWEFGFIPYCGLIGTTSNYAYINSNDYGAGNAQNTDLITPRIDLTDCLEPVVSFTHYFRRGSGNATGTLSYSIDDGLNWVIMENWSETTANPAYCYFTVPQIAGYSEVRFRWNYTAEHDRNWCIDDVIVADATSAGTIEGTVTLMGDYGNVTDVEISASGFTTNPDNNGNYSLQLIPGLYAARASLEYYETLTLEEVLVEPNSTTSGVDFELQFISPPAPEYLNATPQNNYESIYLVWYLSPDLSETREAGFHLTPDSRRLDILRNFEFLGFNVYRNEQMINDELLTQTNFTDNDIVPGSTYNYYVTALYDIAESDPSESVMIIVPPKVSTPVFSPEAGSYEEQILVTISSDTDETNIYYTLNGSDPTQSSHLYSEPILLNQDTTLKARGYKTDWLPSDIAIGDYEIVSSIEDPLEPLVTKLHNAIPNPFNPDTTIKFSLAEESRVNLVIYNITGQKVQNLIADDLFLPGYHQIYWNGKDATGENCSSGVYFYLLQTDNGYRQIKKMTLLK